MMPHMCPGVWPDSASFGGGMVTWQVLDVVPCMAKVSEAAAHTSESPDSWRQKRVKGLMEGTKFCRVLWQKLCLLWGL